MKLSTDLDQAVLDAKDILKDRTNVQVKFIIRKNNIESDSSTIYIRKINPGRIEKLKNELEKKFPDGVFDEISVVITKIPIRKVKCPNCSKEMQTSKLTRHLKSCIKGNYCPICQKAIDGIVTKHIEQCSKRYYTCNVCGGSFNTGARRTAHEKKCKVVKEATTQTALGGLFKIIEIIPPSSPDYEGVLEDQTAHIADILEHEIGTTLKFFISLEVEISLDGESKIANFQSRATHLTKTMNFDLQIKQHNEILIEKIETYTCMGSSWEVENINTINIMVTHL
tara:strand:+ start:57 stop:902 length:846 start_codon:yes stop_codon:yes gene_type:complete